MHSSPNYISIRYEDDEDDPISWLNIKIETDSDDGSMSCTDIIDTASSWVGWLPNIAGGFALSRIWCGEENFG